MKNLMMTSLATFIAASLFAAPEITNVAVAQDPLTHVVTVSYDLNEDAIVTVAFLTNGVVCETSKAVAGDVWRLVKVTGELKKGSTTEYMSYPHRKLSWNVAADLGETNLAKYSLAARVTAWSEDSPPTYYVLDLANAVTRRRYYEYEGQLPFGIGSDVYRTTQMVFRRIPAAGATFVMGAPAAETQAAGHWQTGWAGAETQHNVTFTKDYYMGVFEVTQAQWLQVIGFFIPPSGGNEWKMPQSYENEAHTLPVQNCARNRWLCGEKHNADSWKGDVDQDVSLGYLSKNTFFYELRQRLGGQSKHYNLPTEAQWEYACRAGTTTAFSDGRGYDASADYSDIAVYGTTQPARVGSKKPNAWGLYDMHGNIAEIVLDNAKRNDKEPKNVDEEYAKDATDPHGWESGFTDMCLRGGSWGKTSASLRSAFRNASMWWGALGADQGFRVAVPVDEL